MKTIPLLAVLFAFIGIAGCSESSATDPAGGLPPEEAQMAAIMAEVGNLPAYNLTQSDVDGLLHMREEEKLARDVYDYLHEKYGTAVFANISRSEARHMSAVKSLLDKYGIADPVKDDARGVFTDTHMSDLYAQLTAAGDKSLLDALIVGATIEDLDIKDLMDLTAGLDKADILLVYNNLTKGSRNHLRAFVSQIQANGGSYAPQYISKDVYDDIVGSSRERGWRGGR